MAPTYTNIPAAATTQVIARSGNLLAIIVGTPVASSTIKVIDNTTGSTANLALITNTTDVKPYTIQFGARGVRFHTGLRIITSGNDNVTLVWE